MASPILSAEKIPVTCSTAIERRMQAKTRAGVLGMRQRSILVLEKLIDLVLLNSVRNNMKSEDGEHKTEYR